MFSAGIVILPPHFIESYISQDVNDFPKLFHFHFRVESLTGKILGLAVKFRVDIKRLGNDGFGFSLTGNPAKPKLFVPRLFRKEF